MNALTDLPRGEYPTAVWPTGLTHLPQAPKVPSNPFTVRFAPDDAKVTTLRLYGATHTVSVETCEGIPPYIDCILLGGKWHSACDTLRDEFLQKLDEQLQVEIAADRADFPQGVEA